VRPGRSSDTRDPKYEELLNTDIKEFEEAYQNEVFLAKNQNRMAEPLPPPPGQPYIFCSFVIELFFVSISGCLGPYVSSFAIMILLVIGIMVRYFVVGCLLNNILEYYEHRMSHHEWWSRMQTKDKIDDKALIRSMNKGEKN